MKYATRNKRCLTLPRVLGVTGLALALGGIGLKIAPPVR
jgi:hypothetical protein